ncbi:hypothetical protein OIDMADRAFT_144217 [Oidiodendron maius Zn]|uniref:Uncharacterized protein n=1 Tax=Oidiodendron maius (strain Zn) TaxID=913774 RepID=A0A0C3DMG2_OIDMZ|nr:hypothetical protein OIDMADRAFT_144217 [Oidiodendron maius Zn]
MHTFWCLGLILALSDITVLGCGTPEHGAFTISSQQELDAQFQNCTAIQYPIYIASNYTGSFVLPNTTTWISWLQTESWIPQLGTFEPSIPNLTSVVGEGVTWIDSGLFIGNAPSVVSVAFPNLSHSFAVIIEGLGEHVVLDFPSLVSVNDSLTVSGNISSVDFPLLTGPLDFATYGDGVSINMSTGQPGGDKEYPLVNITFPSLEKASAHLYAEP